MTIKKTQEYLQFTSHVYPLDPYKNSLNADKVYRFMFYQTFWGEKKGGKGEHPMYFFIPMTTIGEAPKPTNPCGQQCFD
jgi:hypothetical protein